MPERLDKFLASQNLGSRKEVSLLVRSGAVTVNGLIAADSAQKIDPEADSIAVNGREINYRKYLYLMMNKPAGVLSATEDRREKTVLDLLPPELRRRGLFPAGRLDKDTTGLLIITDDGEFAHRMLAPKSHIYKLYEARTLRPGCGRRKEGTGKPLWWKSERGNFIRSSACFRRWETRCFL